MRATGEIGVIKVGFQQAASIRRWTLTSIRDVIGGMPTTTIVARVVACNSFIATLKITSVWLDMGAAWWKWNSIKAITPILPGAAVEIEVEGNPEVERHN